MAVIKADLWRIKVGTKTIMHEVEVNWGITSNMIDVANKDNPLAKEAGLKEYPTSGTGYAGNSDGQAQEDLNSLAAWADEQSIKTIEFADGTSGNLAFTGTAYLSDFQLGATVNDKLSYSFTLTVVTGSVGTTS